MNDNQGDIDVRITSREYSVAFEIRGLKEHAHMMVMTARQDATGGYVLKGSAQAFDELASDLLDEIDFQISPGLSLRALRSLYNKIAPDDVF